MKIAVVLNLMDNVATVLDDVNAGEDVSYQVGNETKFIKALDNIPKGHKIALIDIASGHHVIKYGFPIGRAAEDIKKGMHVHVHNVSSIRTEVNEC